jgi:EpsI family protein
MQISLSRAIITSCLMLFTLGFIMFLSESEAIPPRKAFRDFPKTISQYTGQEARFDQEIYDVLGVDDSVLISYKSSAGEAIQLYVGYHNSQQEGDLMHSPKNCLPGSGWDITETALEDIVFPSPDEEKIGAIRLLIKKGISQQVVLYWFQSRGRFISSEYMQKVYLVLDAITKNRTDGAFVRLMAPVTTGETVETTTETLKAFAGNLIPVLEEYLPGKHIE